MILHNKKTDELKKENFVIWTDGACSPNPGKGGWAAIIVKDGSDKRSISGFYEDTTNNRMELTAAIEALKAVPEGSNVTLWSDSRYIVNAFNEGWIKKWNKNGWKKSDNSEVANRDLWEELVKLSKNLDIIYIWTKGHADNKENNECDALARNAIK